MGSKVPPKIPTFTSTSLEIEHRLADSDLVAGHRAGPPQGPYDTGLLELALETLDALPVSPVGLEREPLDALARDDVATVLLCHPDPLPRWPEDAVLTLRNPGFDRLIPHLAQPLFEPVAKPGNAFRRGRGDLKCTRKGLLQVGPELLVEEVDLVQHYEGRFLGESGGVELGTQGTFRPF